jgi:hypothetical protein
MNRLQNIAFLLTCAGLLAASPDAAHADQAADTAAQDPAVWAKLQTPELAEEAGGSQSFNLGSVVDDIQLNNSTTVTTMQGNTISGFAAGSALGNSMSDVHGVGNTMVVNTGVLTMSNSVNLNVTVDMVR